VEAWASRNQAQPEELVESPAEEEPVAWAGQASPTAHQEAMVLARWSDVGAAVQAGLVSALSLPQTDNRDPTDATRPRPETAPAAAWAQAP
jgi:hypothetical protein